MWVIFPFIFGFVLPVFFLLVRLAVAVGILYLLVQLIQRIFPR